MEHRLERLGLFLGGGRSPILAGLRAPSISHIASAVTATAFARPRSLLWVAEHVRDPGLNAILLLSYHGWRACL